MHLDDNMIIDARSKNSEKKFIESEWARGSTRGLMRLNLTTMMMRGIDDNNNASNEKKIVHRNLLNLLAPLF